MYLHNPCSFQHKLLSSTRRTRETLGNTAHVAGEIVVDKNASYHQLDVTKLIRKCKQKEITFVLIRELRQLGDDSDNGKSCYLDTKESNHKPILSIW